MVMTNSATAGQSPTPASPVAAAPSGPPTTTELTTTWRGDRRYELTKPNGARAMIDAAAVDGLGPVDTMLGALAACASIDVVSYLEKRRTPTDLFSVAVRATRRAETPRRVVAVALTFELTGAAIDETHAVRAIGLSVGRYCSVAASLAPDIALDVFLSLNGQAPRPVLCDVGATA
jgi:putative redox protein